MFVNFRKNEFENPVKRSGSLHWRLDEFLDDVGALLVDRKLENLTLESLLHKVLVESEFDIIQNRLDRVSASLVATYLREVSPD